MTEKRLERIPRGWARAPAVGRIALRLGVSATRRLLGDRGKADEQLGQTLLEELDQLKGMAMKVGQILSYMDVALPAEISAQLQGLRSGQRPLAGEVITAIIAQELGAPVERLFASFDQHAIAAASIGQVHRACTTDGQQVVVKVRYPDIASSFDADFRRLGQLGGMAGLITAVDGGALVRELHARVKEECDYRREARWQRRFGELFQHCDSITVPRVFSGLSSDGVLTSGYHQGATLEAYCDAKSSAQRAAAGMSLFRFAFEPLLLHGLLHADPHPGNQLFVDAGIVALDYGCVRAFDAPFMAAYRAFSLALLDDDRNHFRRHAVRLGLAPKPDKLDFDELWRMYCWLYQPMRQPHFRFDRQWWHAGREFYSPTAKNARYQGMPPAWLWLQRVHWGLSAVLVKLEAEGNFAALYRSALMRGERAAAAAVTNGGGGHA